MERAVRQEGFSPKAIIFDFEGTLTKSDNDHTTWERLWAQLGYDDNECGKLEHRYFKHEIDHEQWCQLTLEKFKEKGLTRDAVRSLGRSIQLIDGFAATIERIHQSQIPMYIVSGSIWDVVISALGEFKKYFARVEANNFAYTDEGVIENIVGTKYDFEGKAEFVKRRARDLNIRTSQILFVGNSNNDEQVKTSGAKTLLVNPHRTGASKQWDYYISHMKSLAEILPIIGITDSASEQPPKATSKADEIIALLKDQNVIDLSTYTVVGGYRRFNPQIRARLLELSQQITSSLSKKTPGRQNYLICAAPGSGKTYFIQEIAKSIGNTTQFIEIDLSKDSEDIVKQRLVQVSGQVGCLCMIDEIDGKAGEQWPYDLIYKKLDVNNDRSSQMTTVFTLIGSSGGTVSGLKDAIKSRYKAKDLIDRIPNQSKYNIEIPPLELGDGICVYVSKILEAAALTEVAITHVAKAAIFHAAMTLLYSPRQLEMLAGEAVGRVRGTTVLQYDHHFESGDEKNKRFWGEYQNAFAALSGNIRIV